MNQNLNNTLEEQLRLIICEQQNEINSLKSTIKVLKTSVKEEQEAKIEAIAKAKAAKELAVNQAKIASARADKDAGWSTAHAKSAGAAPREQDRKTKNPPQCRFGNRCNNHKCTFSHDAVAPRPSQPCHFFFTRNGCNNGGRCTFTHSAIAPNGSVTTQLCLSYQKGTCKDSNCTRYHKDR